MEIFQVDIGNSTQRMYEYININQKIKKLLNFDFKLFLNHRVNYVKMHTFSNKLSKLIREHVEYI